MGFPCETKHRPTVDSLMGNRLRLANANEEILKRGIASETSTCSRHDHNVNIARHLSVVVYV